MSREASHIVSKLLGSQGRLRTVAAAAVLFLGITLLLLSVQAWWNFSLLLASEQQDTRSSFLVVGKAITERNMGTDNTFSPAELADLKAAPGVMDAAPVTPALFPAYATLGGAVSMATDLPLEAVADKFLDTIPPGWGWHPGQRDLPIIVSAQFFDIYNYVFAPGQGLPQLSHHSATMLSLKLVAGGPEGTTYNAHVVGFTNRFGSVLVPQSFIDFGNKTLANSATARPSQIVLHASDGTRDALNAFLQQKGYTTNGQNLHWSKLQTAVKAITTGSGIIALLLMGISGLVFSLFIQLTLARAAGSLILLRQLGYSASFLRKRVNAGILPMTAVAIFGSLLVSIALQWWLSGAATKVGLALPGWPGLPVWGTALAAATLLNVWLAATTRKIIKG